MTVPEQPAFAFRLEIAAAQMDAASDRAA